MRWKKHMNTGANVKGSLADAMKHAAFLSFLTAF